MRTTVIPQTGETVRFDGDKYKYLMIRKRACDAVRKTDKQGVYEAVERGKGKHCAK